MFVVSEKEKQVLLYAPGLNGRDDSGPFTLTDWAESQLYTHFGVRERWFSFVDLETKKKELALRLEKSPKHRFRPMTVGDLSVIRGFVSPQYADFPDTEVIDALVSVFHDPTHTRLLRGATKTYQCLYASVTDERISSIELGKREFRLGFTLLNSEVGYTSLRILPVMNISGADEGDIIVPIPSGKLYRKIHRGNIKNLHESFQTAVRSYEGYFGDFSKMVAGLNSVRYASVVEAVEALRPLMERCRATSSFIEASELAVYAQGEGPHTALTLVEAIAFTASRIGAANPDKAFTLASVAGAVAAHVVR